MKLHHITWQKKMLHRSNSKHMQYKDLELNYCMGRYDHYCHLSLLGHHAHQGKHL